MKTMLNHLIVFNPSLKLTQLRKDVLTIIMEAKKPISATNILRELKKNRGNAEPPTAYRVIEYLLEKGVIHKINSENKYVLCSHIAQPLKSNEHGFIFICKKCSCSKEIKDKKFRKYVHGLTESYLFLIDNSPIEINGICENCQ